MGVLTKSPSMYDPAFYEKKRAAEEKAGGALSVSEFIEKYYEPPADHLFSSTGTSIFDPALCELNYLWFTKEGDNILDPFAGGDVRGVVAVQLGRHYTGIDLRQEQIDANVSECEKVCTGEKPTYICGDSNDVRKLAFGEYDFIFTCPPYGYLEKYSDDPNDLSNLSDDDFDESYENIIRESVAMLKDDRFICFVVGNYRDKNGFLRDLVGITVEAMENAGARYYNDMIVVTPCGSLPIRAAKQFSKGRKIGRTHQYCLCFVKGDPFKASERLGEIEIPDLSEYEEEE